MSYAQHSNTTTITTTLLLLLYLMLVLKLYIVPWNVYVPVYISRTIYQVILVCCTVFFDYNDSYRFLAFYIHLFIYASTSTSTSKDPTCD